MVYAPWLMAVTPAPNSIPGVDTQRAFDLREGHKEWI